MKLELNEPIKRTEWLKYLGVSGSPDENLNRQMEEAERLLFDAADPRGIYRVIGMNDVPLEGFSIRKHLEGCERIAVMAVTVGHSVDELIKRVQLSSMALAVVIDTGASVLAEQAADQAERLMKEELERHFPGAFYTPRFSPGYGDYPVSCQREVLSAADAGRKIGISLTGGNMMVPHKSVTALVGIADHPVSGRLATCGECVLRGKCRFLKDGGHC